MTNIGNILEPRPLIHPNDRCCANCNGSKDISLPIVGAKSDADHYGFSICHSPNPRCDHIGHITTIRHICEYWEE